MYLKRQSWNLLNPPNNKKKHFAVFFSSLHWIIKFYTCVIFLSALLLSSSSSSSWCRIFHFYCVPTIIIIFNVHNIQRHEHTGNIYVLNGNLMDYSNFKCICGFLKWNWCEMRKIVGGWKDMRWWWWEILFLEFLITHIYISFSEWK